MVFVIFTGTTKNVTINHLVQDEKKNQSNNQKIFNNTKEGSKGGNVGPKKEKYKTYRKQNGKIKFFICNLIKYKLIKLYN